MTRLVCGSFRFHNERTRSVLKGTHSVVVKTYKHSSKTVRVSFCNPFISSKAIYHQKYPPKPGPSSIQNPPRPFSHTSTTTYPRTIPTTASPKASSTPSYPRILNPFKAYCGRNTRVTRPYFSLKSQRRFYRNATETRKHAHGIM